jgi:glycosyltransferase involved in cell wall biosynthesis
MKILYVFADTGDFRFSRLPMARAAQGRGCSVLIAAPGATLDPDIKENGFTGIELPRSPVGFSPATVLKTLWMVWKIMRAERPDIVHAITLKYSFITALAARGMRPRKLVLTIAGLGYLFSRGAKPDIMRAIISPFLKFALRHPSAHITFQNCDDMNLMITKNYVRAERATLIRGSGVDLQKFSPVNNAESKPLLVLMPTRLIHDKGISVFVEMAKILEKRRVQARFQTVGGVSGQSPRAIKKEEMETMLRGSPVEWPGKVSDMAALYAQAAVIVFPSWYNEGIPRVLLEGAAMGKPLVTTDHPGCREAVKDGVNGFLVPVKDAVATADAVEKLLGDEDLRKKMGRESRILAEAEFDIEKTAEQTLRVYGF